ncbi:putative IS1 encoded protein [Shigella flexneri K-1770]|nr:putative transposase [Shigella flexneri VA-6]EIQ19621.1 putative IS1 encoded protein [Shigella flexneri K-1770]
MPCFTAMRAEIALMSGSAFAVTHHAFSSGAGRTSDGNGSHASTLKSPSYTKSVSWQHYQLGVIRISHGLRSLFFLPFVYSQEEGVSVVRECPGNTLLLHHALTLQKQIPAAPAGCKEPHVGRRCRSAKDDRQSDRYLKGKPRYR